MKELIARLLYFFQAPTYARTLSILAVLLLAAAVPLTLYVGQKEQETRSRAAFEGIKDACTNSTDDNGWGCSEGPTYYQCGGEAWYSCDGPSGDWYADTHRVLVQKFESCYDGTTRFLTADAGECQYGCNGSTGECNSAPQQPTNPPQTCTGHGGNGQPCYSRDPNDACYHGGDNCDNPYICVSGTCREEEQDPDPTNPPNSCANRGGNGQPCWSTNPNNACYNGGNQCRSPYTCQNGTCRSQTAPTEGPEPTSPGQPTSGPTSGPQPTSPGGGNACGVTQRQPSGSKCLGQSCDQDAECKTGYCTGRSPNRICTNADGTTTAPTATTAPQPTVTPTGQPTATPTSVPGGVAFNLSLVLQGIGGSGENPNPRTPTRSVTVELFTTSEQPTGIQKTGSVTYNSSTGKFVGTVDMGVIPNADYIVKVKTPRYLRKRIPGIFTTGASLTFPPLVIGDTNNDNTVNILDWNNVARNCFDSNLPITDPRAKYNSPACQTDPGRANTDLNDDGKVDGTDHQYVLRSLVVRDGD